jgi:hypothetical protein
MAKGKAIIFLLTFQFDFSCCTCFAIVHQHKLYLINDGEGWMGVVTGWILLSMCFVLLFFLFVFYHNFICYALFLCCLVGCLFHPLHIINYHGMNYGFIVFIRFWLVWIFIISCTMHFQLFFLNLKLYLFIH